MTEMCSEMNDEYQDTVFKTMESRQQDRRLYCICKLPDDPTRMMIACNFCDEWFHPSCVGLSEDDVSEIATWHCPGCIELMTLNPAMSHKGLLGFQGRVAPKDGWCDTFPVTDIDETIIVNTVKTKRHKVEGWTLFREGKVTGLSSNCKQNFIYFRAQCQAAMRQNSYVVYMCLKNGGQNLKWATCSCPAGIDGQCKHLVASLYLIIDIFRQDAEQIPDIKTCTDTLQMWHVRKPLTDEPLLFSDINFVKHEPEKPVKRDLCAVAKFHNPVPDFASAMGSAKIQKLVHLYDMSGIRLPVLETIRSNSFCPVAQKQNSDVDLTEEMFEAMKDSIKDDRGTLNFSSVDAMHHFDNIVKVDLTSAKLVEKNTRLQSRSSFWYQQREFRLTSSIFGTFCHLKPTTDPVKTFKMKSRVFTSRSVKHGINYEAQAFAKYLDRVQCVRSSVGLVINPEMPFLAASPDRLVKIDNCLRLVEIKCPYSLFQRKTTIRQQMKEKSFYLQVERNEVTLKKTHDYYHQIQGQLHITGVESCDLVVFVPPDDIVITNIKKDTDFFESMYIKLKKIYFEHLLPSFVDLHSYHN